MTFWSGYRRSVREAGRCQQIFVPRVRCRRCRATHVLLPCFVLAGRLDVAETVGTVLAEVVEGPTGVRPAAAARRGSSHDGAGVAAAVLGPGDEHRRLVRGARRRARR